tara:strand:+ start:2365 stop:3474 length:1110 start_codon:yes stop_codon:yes gene_type:complete
MALPTKDIFLRSPYWINVNETELDYVLCDLRVWTGALTDEPTYPNIKLRSTAFDDKASFDIAEFARDYVEVTFSGTADSNAVFVSYQLSFYLAGSETAPTPETKEYLAGYDGYGTFQDGTNFSWYKQVMISDTTFTLYTDTNSIIPVKQNLLTGYRLFTRQAGTGLYHNFHTVTGLTPTEDTGSMVVNVNTSNGGVYADRVVLEYSVGLDETIELEYQDCSSHGLTEIFFVNRLGATQSMHFSGKFAVTIAPTKDTYKRNLISNGSYSTTRHQKYVLNKNATVNMKLNSGWINETNNDTIIEMLLSEQVWVKVKTDKLGVGWVPKQSSVYIIPCNITSEDISIKSRLNDKLINYTFDIEAAHDWVNNVR